ncbi:MAG: RNA methyltransferase [Bacteroidales bacterium]|nr:RNA methyltransferase [Bacteroidales bacterium]
MLSKNQLKLLHSLRLGKFREQHQLFIVEGIKMVDELIMSDFQVHTIYGLGDWYSSRSQKLTERKIDFHEISEDELHKASSLVTPNAVLAVAAIPDASLPTKGKTGDLVILLDQIQDPGNLGTIIRTADWFGVRYIICSPGTVDSYNPKVVQATMGSIFRVKVIYHELQDFIDTIAGTHQVAGAFLDGEDIRSALIALPAAVIIGNESKGISKEIDRLVQQRVRIPSFSVTAESLNASVAAGILCWEYRRRG